VGPTMVKSELIGWTDTWVMTAVATFGVSSVPSSIFEQKSTHSCCEHCCRFKDGCGTDDIWNNNCCGIKLGYQFADCHHQGATFTMLFCIAHMGAP
jgi:hypothetical protein